jgi:hypothetical protein
MLWTILAVMVVLYAVGKVATGASFLVAIATMALALGAANVIAALYVAREGGIKPARLRARGGEPAR